MKRPTLILPGPSPSELWLPPGVRGLPTPESEIPADLPSELHPADERFVVIRRGEPDDEALRVARCAPTLEDLEFGDEPHPGIPDMCQVLDVIRQIPFEAAMTHLSPIAADVYHHDFDRERQIALARRVYGGAAEAVVRFVEADPSHVAFDERYIAVLQRLLIEHASDSTDEMTDDQREMLLAALLSVPTILIDDSPGPPADPDKPTQGELDAWVHWIVRTGAYYEKPYVLEAYTRAWATLFEARADGRFDKELAQYPIDDWMADDHGGVDLRDQFAAGLAVAIGSRVISPDLTLEERLQHHLERGFLPTNALGGREEAVFAAISASRDELRVAFAAAGTSELHVAWDRAPFEQHPFLRLTNGRLQPISPRAVISWFTDGLYYRLLDAAGERRHPKKPEKTLAHGFTGFYGGLSERAAIKVVQEAMETSVAAGAASVHDEIPFTVGGDSKLSSDIIIDQTPELVAIEAYSGRLTREARVTGSAATMEKDLQKILIGKLDELDLATEALLAGHIDVPDLAIEQVSRVWPVLLLTGHGLLSTPFMARYIQHRLRDDAFSNPRMAPPTVCDLGDLEPMLALAEQDGRTLPDLLAELHASPFADLPPRNFLFDRFGDRVEHLRPHSVKRRSDAAVADMKSRLFQK